MKLIQLIRTLMNMFFLHFILKVKTLDSDPYSFFIKEIQIPLIEEFELQVF
jgi:hypothetical protein